jgi:copper binding plastocyanin/azurin family protein
VQVVAPSPSGGGPSAGAPGEGPPPSSPELPRFVSVSAREWSLTLSRPVVGTGSVTVELRNVGEDPHNLVLSPDDGSHTPLSEWAETGPGEHLRKAVTLPPGRYLLFCSLEGHEAAGMSARLRVE